MEKYKGTLSAEEKTRAIGIISSRGCPSRCVFCSNSLNRRVRYRSSDRFVDEIEYLQDNYGFPGLNFQDDSFTINTRHVIAICNKIIERKIKVRWYCSLRVNNVSYDLLALMKEAGCVSLGFGLETGSDRLLKQISKGINTVQVFNAMELSKKLGYKHVSLFLMTSLPGETLEDIRITNEFLNETYSRLDNTHVKKVFDGTPTYIYPGTETERIAKQNGNIFPDDFSWNSYFKTERAKVFNTNPYVPHFENPDLSLEDIKAYLIKLTLESGKANMMKLLISNLRAVRAPKDLFQLLTKILRKIRFIFNLK